MVPAVIRIDPPLFTPLYQQSREWVNRSTGRPLDIEQGIRIQSVRIDELFDVSCNIATQKVI
jgi:hypothetical protein